MKAASSSSSHVIRKRLVVSDSGCIGRPSGGQKVDRVGQRDLGDVRIGELELLDTEHQLALEFFVAPSLVSAASWTLDMCDQSSLFSFLISHVFDFATWYNIAERL